MKSIRRSIALLAVMLGAHHHRSRMPLTVATTTAANRPAAAKHTRTLLTEHPRSPHGPTGGMQVKRSVTAVPRA